MKPLSIEDDELRKIIVETPLWTVIAGALLGTIIGQVIIQFIEMIVNLIVR